MNPASEQSSPQPRSTNVWFLAAILISLTVFAYLPAIQGDFVWDDDTHLTDNILLEPDGLYRVWFTTDTSNYWPLTFTSYWIEHRAFGLAPTAFHITNLVIHILCSLLIWRVLLDLKIPGAWFAALLFAIHPVNVETVAWITQRKNLLSMLFYLVALAMFFRFERRESISAYVLAVVAFVLAMLSKGGVVTMPIVLLICAWWQRSSITRQDVVRSLPFFAVSLLFGLIEIWFQNNVAIREDVVREDGILTRLACSGWVVWFYFYKAVLPINLSFVYPRWEIDATNGLSYVPGFLLVGMLILFWRNRNGWGRAPLFALLYFVITLGPFLGFLNIYFFRYSFVADHYQHQSLIAIIAIVVGYGTVTINSFGSRAAERPGVAPVIAAVLIGCLTAAPLLFVTRHQSAIYQNKDTLWADTIAKNPACWLGHNHFAHRAFHDGDLEKAKMHQLEVVKYEPEKWRFYFLGQIHFELGEDAQAKAAFHEACSYDPTQFEDHRWAIFSDAHHALGLLALKEDRRDDAIRHFKIAIGNHPRHERAIRELERLSKP